MRYLLLLSTSLWLFSCSAIVKHGQKNYKPAIVKSAQYRQYNKYQKDFLHLSTLCQEGFPLIDTYFPPEQRKPLEQEILTRLGAPGVNDKIFTVQSRKYLAHFQNQHTSISTPAKFQGIFPFKIYNQGGNWHLLNISNQYDSTLLGRKIISVNQQPVTHFVNNIEEYVFAENEVNRRKSVVKNGLYNKSGFLKLAGIIPQADSILLEVEGVDPFWLKNTSGKKPIRFHYQKKRYHSVTGLRNRSFDYQLFPEKDLAYLQINRFFDKDDIQTMMSTYVRPAFRPLVKLYLKRQFKKKEPSRALSAYFDPQRPSFKAYLSEMMEKIDSLQLEYLVVDLRNNPGGNLMLGKQLMYFLSEEQELNDFKKYHYTSVVSKYFQPRKYQYFEKQYLLTNPAPLPEKQLFSFSSITGDSVFFSSIKNPSSPYYVKPNRPVFKGRVYVLADWTSGSAAALLAALLQDNGMATIIGTSVGNNPTGPTTFTPFTLPETKAAGSIASTYLVRPDSTKPEVLQPDFWVEPSLEDLLTGQDPAWEKALELIHLNQKSSYQPGSQKSKDLKELSRF